MNRKVAHIAIVVLCTFASFSVCAQARIAPSKSEYRLGEELMVNYSDLPPLGGNEFYLMVVKANNGANVHDSKSIKGTTSGSLKFKRMIRPGTFELVLYKYSGKDDRSPEQIKSASVRAVSRLVALNEDVLGERDEPEKEKPQAKEVPATAKVEKAAKKPVKKQEPVRQAVKEPVVLEVEEEEPEPELDPEEQAALLKDIFSSVSLEGEYRPKAPPPPSYLIKPQSEAKENSPIVLRYALPALSSDQQYQIRITKPAEEVSLMKTGNFSRNEGTASFDGVADPGLYEVKVIRMEQGRENLLYSQFLVVGAVDRTFPGRYTCINRKPFVAGNVDAAGPNQQEVVRVFTENATQRHLKPWLISSDVCIEVQGLEFLPASVVTFPSQDAGKAELSVPAFPVRFVYRIVVNDFANRKSSVVEEARFKHLYFFKGPDNKWLFTTKPGSQGEEYTTGQQNAVNTLAEN